MNNKALVALLSMITLNACTKPSTTTRSANNNAGLFATMRDLRQGNYQRHIDTQQHSLKQQQEIISQSQQHYLALKQLEKENLQLLIKQHDLLRKQMELLINRNG